MIFWKNEKGIHKYRIKYWMYNYDRWIISLIILLLFTIVSISVIDVVNNDSLIKGIEFRVWIAMILGLITILFAFMRQKHNDMSIFFSQFEKYNDRYDLLNNNLNTIHNVTSKKGLEEKYEQHPFKSVSIVTQDTQNADLMTKTGVENILDDYLNLCAEEYMAYSKGYIPPNIMVNWVKGMEVFFRNKYMGDYFKDELDTESYYNFKEYANKQFELGSLQ